MPFLDLLGMFTFYQSLIFRNWFIRNCCVILAWGESRLASGSFAYYKMKTFKFSPVKLKACLFEMPSAKVNITYTFSVLMVLVFILQLKTAFSIRIWRIFWSCLLFERCVVSLIVTNPEQQRNNEENDGAFITK